MQNFAYAGLNTKPAPIYWQETPMRVITIAPTATASAFTANSGCDEAEARPDAYCDVAFCI